MLLLVGSQSVKLFVPWPAGRAIDTVQTSGTEHIGVAALITVAILLVYALAWSMHGPGRIIERNVGLRERQAVADALYAKLAALPLGWHEAHHSADMQQRAQQASMALSNFAQAKWCAVDLLTVGLSWLLVGVYVWRVRSDAAAGAPLLLGGVLMVYQYAQQAGGVIGAMARTCRTSRVSKPITQRRSRSGTRPSPRSKAHR